MLSHHDSNENGALEAIIRPGRKAPLPALLVLTTQHMLYMPSQK